MLKQVCAALVFYTGSIPVLFHYAPFDILCHFLTWRHPPTDAGICVRLLQKDNYRCTKMIALNVLTIPPLHAGPALVLCVWCWSGCTARSGSRPQPPCLAAPGASAAHAPATARQQNKSSGENSFATHTSAIHFVCFAGREAKWYLSS